MIRRLWQVAAALGVLGLALLCYAWWLALQPPIIREASIAMPGWPAGEPPRTVLLITDTHVAGPDMPPSRLAAIVRTLNARKPDLVVLTGDYVSDKAFSTHRYSAEEAIAPLGGLRAPLGVVAVLGNHDYWRDAPAFRQAFARHRLTLLANQAIRRGPFVIGGIDDAPTGHQDIAATERAMAALGSGLRLVISHSPDILPRLSAPVTAVLAGHTHCGQIALPFIGPIVTMSRYGRRFACGRVEHEGTTLFVSAGIGTSVVPLRFGVPPDVWLIRFGPASSPAPAR